MMSRLIQPSFKVLRDFIESNLAMIVNMREESPGESETVGPALFVESSGRRTRKRAYVLGFWKTERARVLSDITRASQLVFLDLSVKVANWLKESLFWPKTYLFMVQFNISEVKSSKGFVGVLLTKLKVGQLAENPETILRQIREGVIDSGIKKGHVFPHITMGGNGLAIEEKVKSFEDQPSPANYFYDFLFLEPPLYAQKLLEETYSKLRKRKSLGSLSKVKESIKNVDSKLLEQGKATIEIDNVEIRVPVSEIDDMVKLAKDEDGYLVCVKGSTMKAKIGKYDLIGDGALQLRSTKEIADEIKARKVSS